MCLPEMYFIGVIRCHLIVFSFLFFPNCIARLKALSLFSHS